MSIHKLVFISTILIVCNSFVSANDSLPWKKNIVYSLNAGYTINTVYGSMHDKDQKENYQAGLGEIKMTNKGGISINFRIARRISDAAYFKTGVSFLYRQVNPQDNTINVYRDELSTGYLSFPLLAGVKASPGNGPFGFFLEFGPLFNVRLFDNSMIGPDRSDFKTHLASVSLCPAGGISCSFPHSTLMLQYTLVYDVTNAYTEYLYWTSSEPRKPFSYKYKTHCFSFGFQWHPF
ncbi:MAG: PorT family protein [Bacteroidetes bacterium]|jgi:hypothetical protein|nr:MAG: PorT family protein [Bacteroidota bacterium]